MRFQQYAVLLACLTLAAPAAAQLQPPELEEQSEKPPATPPTSPLPASEPSETAHFERPEPVHVMPPSENALPEVTVQGRSVPPSSGASDHRILVGELKRVPRKNAAELLKLAPGIFLSNDGGEGHAERIYVRGFDAREGQDLEFSIDGVPINESGNLHGNGLADLGFIIPELVTELRVVEGPFDPRQGNYAVAGSADYQTGLDERGLTGKFTLGSFGTERALLLWGPFGESVGTYAGAEVSRTDGFGENRDARSARAMGQYEGRLGSNARFRLSGSGYGTEYHSAGLLRDDDVRAGRKGFYDTYDTRQGGSASRYQLAFDIESKSGATTFAQKFFLIRRGMRVRENFTGYLLDTQEAIQTPHDQRGDLLDSDVSETTYGGRGFARTTFGALGKQHELELGYFARGDDVASFRQRIETATGVPYRTDTDLESRLGDIGLYADLVLRPIRRLTLKGGVRADWFFFDVFDRCAVEDVSRPSPENPPGDASCLEQQRFGRHREPEQRSSTAGTKLLPRASVAFGPLGGFTGSLSYGTGVRSIDPSYVTQDVATPFASIIAYEGGVTFARDFGALDVAARSVFFQTHVDKDHVFSETEGRSVIGGGTTRTGWSGLCRLKGDFFDENASVTLVRSVFDETNLLVPYAPGVVVRSDSAVFFALPAALDGAPPRASFGAGVSYVGERALPYGELSDTIFTVDASFALAWKAFELELETTNLFGAQYRQTEFNYVSDFDNENPATLVPARHFAAGPPRQIFVSLSATLGDS
jgi:hypothetical protein